MKTKFKNFVNTIVKPAIRGVVKSIPFGNVALEVVRNIGHEVKQDLPSVSEGGVVKDSSKPHNWISIITQLACLAVVLYAFFTKSITIEDVLKFLGFN